MKKAGIIAIYLIIVLALVGCTGTDTFVEDTVSPTAAPTEATTAQPSPSEQLTATQTPSPEPTQEPISFNEPSEIFNEAYNPFYLVELPENYSAYQIAFWLTDENRLSVNIVAQDTAENVVAFFADLAGYDSEEISNINTEKIKMTFR